MNEKQNEFLTHCRGKQPFNEAAQLVDSFRLAFPFRCHRDTQKSSLRAFFPASNSVQIACYRDRMEAEKFIRKRTIGSGGWL